MIETSLSFKEINFDPWIFVQSSWQLVFWPATGKCYQIFSQGPCPPTQVASNFGWTPTSASDNENVLQELGFSKDSQKPECR